MRIYRVLSISTIEEDRYISTCVMYNLNKYHERSKKIFDTVNIQQIKRKT